MTPLPVSRSLLMAVGGTSPRCMHTLLVWHAQHATRPHLHKQGTGG